MRIDTLLADATCRLTQAGVVEAALDARLLLQHLTGLTRSEQLLRAHQQLDAPTVARYRDLIKQRSRRIPLQHLTGSQEFWSLDFTVSPAVLIPRPETEFLLEQVVRTCAGTGVARALDLCTGSGVIAVVLAKELRCRVVATDISEAALRVAWKNIVRHGMSELILPVGSDLFAALNRSRPFDLIVSNPPYVAEEEVDRLEPEVCRAEPRLALSGGVGGMRCIERIAMAAPAFLRPGGWIFVEIGADQGEAVERLFCVIAPGYVEVRIHNDWAGRPRVLQARIQPSSTGVVAPQRLLSSLH